MSLQKYTNILRMINQIDSQRGRTMYFNKIGKVSEEKLFEGLSNLLKKQDRAERKMRLAA